MRTPRRRPKLLPLKILAIRDVLNVGKAEMATKLQSEILSHSRRQCGLESARVSEYEKGKREPNLFVLIAYARLGNVHMESVIDDDVTIDQFRKRLGKEFHYPPLRPTKSTKPVISKEENGKNKARIPRRLRAQNSQ